MKPSNQTSFYGSVFCAQLAYLAIEQPPINADEIKRLEQLKQLINDSPDTDDLRCFAALTKKVMGAAYTVGSGTAHVWIKRVEQPERLAIIADRKTTSYRDYNHAHNQQPEQAPEQVSDQPAAQ